MIAAYSSVSGNVSDGPRCAGTISPISPAEIAQAQAALRPDAPWRVVVLNDPVNTMGYVVLVFRKVFGFSEAKARHHMLETHEKGRSVVWSGLREQAEMYVFALQQWHLTARLESDEAH